MLAVPSLSPHYEAHSASWGGRFVSPANPAPRQNRLLAALPAREYEWLLPRLEPMALPLGWAIHDAGDREKHLYFPTAGIVSRLHVTRNGSATEFAITGNEGVIGVASFLGAESTLSQAVVLSPGFAYRLGADLLGDVTAHARALPQLLLLYTQALLTQIGQMAVCNRHHSLEQQLCRWILTCLDRRDSNELAVTHELIANVLGVRREGVTEAAGRLQKAGLIHYSRGHMTVLDRGKLEARVCECYAVVKREYERLFPNEATWPGSCESNVRRALDPRRSP